MILVVGSLNMDLVVRSPRLPLPGETLSGGPFATYPGGKGANQAVAAARLGAPTALIGRVGDDDFGRALRATIAADQVIGERVLHTEHTATGVALITVEEGGQNTIVIAPGANAALTPADIDAATELFEQAQILLLQLEVPIPVVLRAAERARAAGATVILNPAPAPLEPLPSALLDLVDYLVPNESEATLLLGAAPPDSPHELAQELRHTYGIPHVIITLGAEGAVYANAAGVTHQPAFSVSAVDATAAGDAFIGGFAAALAAALPANEGLRWGCAAGALAATRPGAQASLPTRSDLRALLD